MKIIAGLGNPGRRYVGTPHNVGFSVVDRLAERSMLTWRRSTRFQAQHCTLVTEAGSVLLLKPQTFMNLSGESVAATVRWHRCELTDLLVVLDDADLPRGRIRLRAGGGSGGHRGLASIIGALGADGFARLRLGIGRGSPDLVNHVLGKLQGSAREEVTKVVEMACDAAMCWTDEGVDSAMNRYNGWSATPAEEP